MADIKELVVVPEDDITDVVVNPKRRRLITSARIGPTGQQARLLLGPPDVPPPPPPVELAVVSSIVAGVVDHPIPWTATVTVGTAARVEFYIDGQLKWTELFAPYTFNGDPGGLLDPATLTEGPHDLSVRAFDAVGNRTPFAGGSIEVHHVVVPPPTPPPDDDLPGWTLIVDEPFDTPLAAGLFPGPYAANFSKYPKGWSDTARSQGKRGGVYGGADNISVHDGMLDLWIHTEAGTHWVSAPTIVPGGVSNWTSLRVEIRWKTDRLPHYKTAWLLWPASNVWPRDGEIDHPERNLDEAGNSAFMHRQGASSGGDQDGYHVAMDPAGWHTSVTAWEGGKVVDFILDGKSMGRPTSRVPNTPMHFVIQTETSLDGVDPADATAGHVLIDSVKVWKKKAA